MTEQTSPQGADISGDDVWQKLLNTAFEAAGLPEVKEEELETGTYTNAQMISKVKEYPVLLGLLLSLPKGASAASNRSVLSFAVDALNYDC